MKKNMAIIGDRIFTDIIVGNRCNIYTILVNPVNKEGNRDEDNKLIRIEKYIANIIRGSII